MNATAAMMIGTRISDDRALAQPDDGELAVEVKDRVALVGHGEREASREQQGGKRHDERGHPGSGDEQPVEQPNGPAHDQGQRDGHDAPGL